MTIEIPTPVLERLASEQVIWLTTSKTDGMPLPNPVWFLWQGSEFLVLAMPDSVKMKNMARNPRISLHFNSLSADGSDVAIFQAEADIQRPPVTDAELQAYINKYDEGLKFLGITREMLIDAYRPVRVTPIRYRTVTG